METLFDEIFNDLKEQIEEEISDKMIASKLKNAIREVKRARNYPEDYTQSMIEEDMEAYYSNILSLALYDINQIGGEGEKSHSDSGTSRTWKDRKECFDGISSIVSYGG